MGIVASSLPESTIKISRHHSATLSKQSRRLRSSFLVSTTTLRDTALMQHIRLAALRAGSEARNRGSPKPRVVTIPDYLALDGTLPSPHRFRRGRAIRSRAENG